MRRALILQKREKKGKKIPAGWAGSNLVNCIK
jgi:hypothetical protein